MGTTIKLTLLFLGKKARPGRIKIHFKG